MIFAIFRLVGYTLAQIDRLLLFSGVAHNIWPEYLDTIIIHSKYFPDSDWLKAYT